VKGEGGSAVSRKKQRDRKGGGDYLRRKVAHLKKKPRRESIDALTELDVGAEFRGGGEKQE